MRFLTILLSWMCVRPSVLIKNFFFLFFVRFRAIVLGCPSVRPFLKSFFFSQVFNKVSEMKYSIFKSNYGGGLGIFKNSILSAYLPEKNQIITPWLCLLIWYLELAQSQIPDWHVSPATSLHWSELVQLEL